MQQICSKLIFCPSIRLSVENHFVSLTSSYSTVRTLSLSEHIRMVRRHLLMNMEKVYL